jgi:hypothetical protein
MRTIVVTFALGLLLTGAAACGSSSSGSTTSATSIAQPTAQQRAAARRRKARDRRRATELRTVYRVSGGRERWSIRGVAVHGGSIIVTTDLYPKPENGPYFIGACTMARDGEWTSSVDVRGLDGIGHGVWSRGDLVCQTPGIN